MRLIASLCVGSSWIACLNGFSTAADLYLIASAIVDGIRIHSLWVAAIEDQVAAETALAALQTCVVVVTVAMIVVREVWIAQELATLRGDGPVQMYEKEAGTLSTLCMAWIVPLASAAKNVGVTEQSIRSISLHPNASYRLDEKGNAPITDHEFFFESVITVTISIVLALAMSGVSLVQPLIVSSIVDYLQGDSPVSKGVWLVIAMFFA